MNTQGSHPEGGVSSTIDLDTEDVPSPLEVTDSRTKGTPLVQRTTNHEYALPLAVLDNLCFRKIELALELTQTS